MKAKISHVLLTLALGAAMPIVSSAATYNLALGIVGNAQVTQTSINFGQFPVGAPYNAPPGYGTFEVNLVNAGPFQSNGVTVGETGMIQSLSAGSFASTPFMTFNGGGSNLTLIATSATVQTPSAGCVDSPFAGGAILLCDTPNGATATLDLNGSLHGDTSNPQVTSESWAGVFQATFAGESVATLLGSLPVATPYSATFTVTTSAIPEPVTFFLMGIGLVGAALSVRRNKARS